MVVLEDVLKGLRENPCNRISKQEVVDVYHEYVKEVQGQCGEKEVGSVHVVTLYLGSKYAQFHEEFTQTALVNPELQPLVKFLDENKYRTNLT